MDLYSDQLRLKASFIGSVVDKAMDWSRRGDLLSVHSVFQRVVNIKTHNELISIVTKSIGKSAAYIVLDDEINFLSFGIKQADTVYLGHRCLNFNNLIIDMKEAQVWNDIIDWGFKWEKSKVDFKNIIAFKAAIDRHAVLNSVWKRNYSDIDLNERIQKLKGKNPSKAVKGLIGLGPGLTPSGDDVLLGFLAVVNTCDNFSPVREAFKDEILANLISTSDISGSFLKLAAENHYHEYVQNVLTSMVFGLPENVLISVQKLLSIGATSGTDIAAGMYLGFLYDVESRMN